MSFYQDSKHNGGEESTNKPLPSLLRWQLEENKDLLMQTDENDQIRSVKRLYC